MTRPISDAWFHRLKSATRDLVRACGGVERAADIALSSKSEVSRWQVATSPDIIPLCAVLALESDCELPLVTTVMAELNGRKLSDGSGGHEAASLVTTHAELLRAGADVTAQVAAALSDGTVTPSEAELIDRAAATQQEKLSDLRRSCAAARAGGNDPPLRMVPRA